MEVWEISVFPLPSPPLPPSPLFFLCPPFRALSLTVSLACSSSIHYAVQACAPTRSVIVCYLGSLFPALPGRGHAALALVLCLLGRSTAHCSLLLSRLCRGSSYLVLESLFLGQGPALPPPIPPGSASGKLLETVAIINGRHSHTDLGPE